MPTLRLPLMDQQQEIHVAEIAPSSSSQKAYSSIAEPSAPCTIASHQGGGAAMGADESSQSMLSVGGCRFPGVTTTTARLISASPKVGLEVDAATERTTTTTSDLFLRKLRTKIAEDHAFRQRLRAAIALHENNSGHRQQQQQQQHDALRAAFSVSRNIPPPSFTRPAVTDRSLQLRRQIEQEIHLSSVLEAELAKRRQQRWQHEQHLRIAALIHEEERELEAERLDLAVQTARLQAQAASVRLAAAHEAELLAADASLTPKRDMFWAQHRGTLAAAPAGSRQRGPDGNNISTKGWDDHLRSLVQGMKASEASFVEVQFLYGAYGSLPSSYRAVINRSQSSRQDILVLLGEKRKKDNCIVEECFRSRPTKRTRKHKEQDSTWSPDKKMDQPPPSLPPSPGSATKKRKTSGGNVPTTTKNKGRNAKKAKRWTWKKKPGAPSRPLSAYNIFFSEERRRIIDEMERKKNEDSTGEDDNDDEHTIESRNEAFTTGTSGNAEEKPSSSSKHPSEFAFDMLMERRINPSSSYKQRKGRNAKTQSMVAYKDLTKTIAARWKSLPAEELAEYKRLAELDTKRYKNDMEKYNNRQEEVAAAETLKDLIRGSIMND